MKIQTKGVFKMTNEPITNQELINAIMAMNAEVNNTNETSFIKELLFAKFLTPVEVITVDATNITNPANNTAFAFPFLGNKNNEKFIAVFTDPFALSKWQNQPNHQVAVLTYKNLAEVITQHNSDIKGFVINPFDHNVIITDDIIKNIQIPG